MGRPHTASGYGFSSQDTLFVAHGCFVFLPKFRGSTGHFSGGILTNWLIFRYPERFRAAVSGAGESNWTANYALSDVARTRDMEFFGPPWEPRALDIMIAQSPFFRCGNTTAATLFIHGAMDSRVPLEGAIQLYTWLKKMATPTKLIIYEGRAHSCAAPSPRHTRAPSYRNARPLPESPEPRRPDSGLPGGTGRARG